MECPKCGWKVVFSASKEVWAKKKDGNGIMILLWHHKCARQGCDWEQEEKYEEKVKEMGLLPYE